MPSILQSTSDFIIGFEGAFYPRRYKAAADARGFSIGYGHFLGEVKRVGDSRQTYGGIDLWEATLTREQGHGLMRYDLISVDKELQRKVRASLTQNQYDALISYYYNTGSVSKNNLTKVINKHANNLAAGEAEIRAAWSVPITNNGGQILNGLITRRKMEQDLFFGTLNGGGIEYYQEQTKKYGKGALNNQEPSVDNIDVSDDTNIEPVNLEFDFERLETHIRNLELDDVEVTWGRRNNNLEDTDWIGLKQFILYLNTTYYQTHLVPFVELIPVYAIDPPELTNNKTKEKYLNELKKEDLDSAKREEYLKFLERNDQVLIDYRFERTAGQLGKLSKEGGVDVLGLDPFQEVSDSFNKPNFTGQRIEVERGYNYRLYGMITLNPSILGEELSKAGAIGFQSLEVESGSQTQNNMSLITVKILDVQGNKLLDINSPWSFLLNSRPGMIGGDFFFRYGWQLVIPPYDISKDSGKDDDENAQKFWNHPGWDLFGGVEVKKFISGIASSCGDVITFSQSVADSSFKNPGYRYLDDDFVIQRAFDATHWDKYLLLTLINPEIAVNQEDGSVTATLYFRTNSVVANFLCPLLKAERTASLINDGTKLGGGGFLGFFKTEGKGYKTDLYTLIKAFLEDNNLWLLKSTPLTVTGAKAKLEAVAFEARPEDFLIVIGGQGKGSVQLDSKSIPIIISNELAGELNRSIQNIENSGLLITWLNKVLPDNGLTTLSAGDQRSVTDTTGTIVIYYDYESRTDNFKRIIEADAINSRLRATEKQVIDDDIYREGIYHRLQMQDDVFSFRFKGSLVEGLSVEKLETPTLQKLIAQQNLAEGILYNPTDISTQSEQERKLQPVDVPTKGIIGDLVRETIENGEEKILTEAEITKAYRTGDNAVTYKDKKNALNILYASMLGASIKCIGHPWLKIGKNIGIKGTGFFDGKYLVTKLKHTIDDSHKFITEINACRVLNQDDTRLKNKLLNEKQNILLNNPGTKFATPASLNKYINSRQFNLPIDATYVRPSVQAQIAEQQNKFPTANEAKLNELNPQFVGLFREFIRRVESETPYKVLITSGWRSVAKQRELSATNPVAADGYSLHNFGLAIDINLTKDGKIIAKSTSNSFVWRATGVVDIANSLGLVWGGNFSAYDPVHFGLDGVRNPLNGFIFKGSTCYAKALNQFGNAYNIIWNRVRF